MSVILPTYNLRDTLGRAVDSVVGQSLGAWELLVVDDASTVDIEAVVSRLRRPRIRCVRRAVNGGVAARKTPVSITARGDVVVFLHSDDALLPAKLERQVDLLATLDASVGAVESAIEVEWPDGVEQWDPQLDGRHPSTSSAYRTRVHISGLMVRRELAAQLRFDEQLRGAEDRDFCLRLLRVTTVECSPEPLSRVSKSGTRLSQQNKGPIYAYLLAKYHDDIAPDRRVHADWQYRIAHVPACGPDE